MAQQILVPVLQRTLAEYLEVTDHSVDLRRGEISLADVSLRRRSWIEGLQVTGKVGKIFARWSWSGLLREPLRMEIVDLAISVSPASDAGLELSSTSSSSLDRPSNNFLERLKRRIVDQLHVTISNVHLRLEGREDENQLRAAGVLLKTFSVAGARGPSLQQTVTLEDASLYVEDSPVRYVSAWDVPDTPFLAVNVSPQCVVSRSSGRRFMDWKGVDLRLELNDTKLTWTRSQLLCLGSLLKDFQKDHDAEQFYECQDLPDRPAVAWRFPSLCSYVHYLFTMFTIFHHVSAFFHQFFITNFSPPLHFNIPILMVGTPSRWFSGLERPRSWQVVLVVGPAGLLLGGAVRRPARSCQRLWNSKKL